MRLRQDRKLKNQQDDAAEPSRSDERNILILGLLQSGKTTLFRHICGRRSGAIDIPRTSESLTRGEIPRRGEPRTFLIDTPGTSTLFPQGEDDMVARDAILRIRPDALLIVTDAKNLRRSLALIIHAAEFQIPAVLALNMEDEAWRYGIRVDVGLLESLLGIDVIPTVGHQGVGLRRLTEKLRAPRTPDRLLRLPHRLETALAEVHAQLKDLPHMSRGLAELLLVRDREAEQLVLEALGEDVLQRVRKVAAGIAEKKPIPPEIEITDMLYSAASRIADQVASTRQVRGRFLDGLGRLAHHPIAGLFIAAIIVYSTYIWVGELGATRVVDGINTYIFEGWLVPLTENLAGRLPWDIARDALVDPDFGLIPTGLFLAFGLVMPVLFFFYFAFNILVASGYLARLSVLLDRVFRVIGLNGKGILPLTMGFSCVTMALITTRMLDSKKERLIASFLLMLGTPCAPLLATMFVVLAPMPITATLTVFGFIATQTLVAGALANRVLAGRTSDFIMEIPPMRVPRLIRVLRQTVRQTYYFMKEAVPLFLLASLVLFGIDRVGGLDLLERVAHPVVHGLLGLPDESVQVFIKTLIRRETGAAELDVVRGGFDNVQLVVTLLVMTFITPCVNAILVLIKERGLRDSSVLIVSVSSYAVLVGALLNLICRAFGVTFT